MAQIRIPEAASAMLVFCEPWLDRPENSFLSKENVCFKTYADLVVFATGYGFHLHGKTQPGRCSGFLSAPTPIDISVFKSQQLLPLILLLGMTVKNSYQVAREEDQLAKLVEDYAALGFTHLAKKLAASTAPSFYLDLARLLSDAAKDDLI
jgi:hypothetical protein